VFLNNLTFLKPWVNLGRVTLGSAFFVAVYSAVFYRVRDVKWFSGTNGMD